MTLKVLELFGGIGACTKAFKRLGIDYKVVDYVEIDKYAVASYNAINGTSFEPQDITKWDKNIDIDFIMHGSPCFVAGTKILTNNGYKNIEDIVIGDKVLTHTNNFNEVIDFGSDGKKPIYKVETSGTLPIYCTDNHPFYVRHKTKIWNNHLRKYDYSFSEPEKVRLYNLTKNNNYIGVPIIPDKDTKFSNMSDETLWLLGRYVADGCYYNRPRKDRPSNTKYTCISVGNKKMQDFESHIKTYKYNIDKYRRGCVNYRFGVEFTNLIIDIGLNKGAMNKHIPLEILQLPKHKLKIFLDGYMSGDGCNIKHTSVYQATTISRELAESLVLAVQKVYNIGCRIYYTKRPKKCIIEDRIVNQNDTYMIRFDLNSKKPLYIVDDNCIWYPIRKISNTNTIQTIYNMTVNDDHSYTANNCYVGNCQDFSVAGLQRGGDEGSETRSSLMYETIRIVKKLKPKYVLWENVKNLISDKHRHNFDNYLNIMSDLGYSNYYEILNARDYGIPQNRERIFTLSIRKDVGIVGGYYFPEKVRLTKRLKDLLENNVSEKYYLSDRLLKYFYENEQRQIENGNGFRFNVSDGNVVAKAVTTCAGNRMEDNFIDCVRLGGIFDNGNSKHQAGSVYDVNGVSPTLDTMQGGWKQPSIITNNITQQVKVRKYNVDSVGDRVYNSDGISTTITAEGGGVGGNSGLYKVDSEVKVIGNYMPSGYDASRIVDINCVAPTVKENHETVTAILENTTDDIDNPLKGVSGQSWQFEQNVYSEDSKLIRTIKAGEGSGNIPKVIEKDTTKTFIPTNTNSDEVVYIRKGENETQHQSNTVYDEDGIARTLVAGTHGNANSYTKTTVNDSRDIVDKMYNPYNDKEITDVAPTLTTTCGNITSSSAVLMTVKDENNIIEPHNVINHSYTDSRFDDVNSKSVEQSDNSVNINNLGLRIRKLTPKECWRLMGFDDSDFDKAEKVNSNAQLYKQAGNSIVVNVLEAILANLFDTGRKQTKKGIRLW